MKKNLLTAMTMALTLWVVSCGKNENNVPDKPEDKTPAKKITQVDANYIDIEHHSTSDIVENFFPNNIVGHIYTLKNFKIVYEYNEAGKISKIIETEAGREDNVYEFLYQGNKMTFKLKNDNGQVVSHEYTLNKNGNIEDFRIKFNEQEQLTRYKEDKLIWENGNLVTVENEKIFGGEKELFEHQFSYYTDKPNKNKFLMWNIEGQVHVSYGKYFGLDIGFPLAAPTKNLVKSVTFLANKKVGYANEYSYTYDEEGFVKTITESSTIEDTTYSVEGTLEKSESDRLKQFVERIKNGTEKGFSYKLISEANGKHTFEIAQPIKLTKDSKGTSIDLDLVKIYRYSVNYTENNGTRLYSYCKLDAKVQQKPRTTYAITY